MLGKKMYLEQNFVDKDGNPRKECKNRCRLYKMVSWIMTNNTWGS